jgi:tetrahydromethanopterin:alpha-L-glutamate ligase
MSAARIAIVTEEPGWHGGELLRVLTARDVEVRWLSLRSCHFDLTGRGPGIVLPGFERSLPDGVLVRDVPGGSLEEVVLRLDLLHALRDLGVRVYNDARAIERTVDKALTTWLLHRAGVPTPPTCVTESPEQARAFLASETAAGHDVVAKPLFGSLGVGLVRLCAGMELPEPLDRGGVWYLQRYIPTAEGDREWRDLRVLVIGEGAVGAMIRHGSSWVSNVAQGARCEAIVLDPELSRLAAAAARAVEADYAGVDLVRDRTGALHVLEVNGIPAWRGLQTTTTIDLAERVATDFLRRLAS